MVCIGNATLQQLDVHKCVLHSNRGHGLAAKLRGGVPRRRCARRRWNAPARPGSIRPASMHCRNAWHGLCNERALTQACLSTSLQLYIPGGTQIMLTTRLIGACTCQVARHRRILHFLLSHACIRFSLHVEACRCWCKASAAPRPCTGFRRGQPFSHGELGAMCINTSSICGNARTTSQPISMPYATPFQECKFTSWYGAVKQHTCGQACFTLHTHSAWHVVCVSIDLSVICFACFYASPSGLSCFVWLAHPPCMTGALRLQGVALPHLGQPEIALPAAGRHR